MRLKEYGLNTYMYAPKDDALHRKLWRQMYDDVEKGWWKIYPVIIEIDLHVQRLGNQLLSLVSCVYISFTMLIMSNEFSYSILPCCQEFCFCNELLNL